METLREVWFRLLGAGFRLLYNELAWAYDLVSWTVSLGRWQEWQQTTYRFLPLEGRVLELASGPGHLLVSLRRTGRWVVGLDASRSMVRLARRRLLGRRLPLTLCRGTATSLPFASGSFAAGVVTFPTSFIHTPEAHHEIARVLKPGGRLVVVEQASFAGRHPLHSALEWLYRLTGQRGPAPDLVAALRLAGLCAEQQTVSVRGTTVRLIVADRAAILPAC